MKKKVSVKYTDKDGFELKIGNKIIDNSIVMSPVYIKFDAEYQRPMVQFELAVDGLEVEGVKDDGFNTKLPKPKANPTPPRP